MILYYIINKSENASLELFAIMIYIQNYATMNANEKAP